MEIPVPTSFWPRDPDFDPSKHPLGGRGELLAGVPENLIPAFIREANKLTLLRDHAAEKGWFDGAYLMSTMSRPEGFIRSRVLEEVPAYRAPDEEAEWINDQIG